MNTTACFEKTAALLTRRCPIISHVSPSYLIGEEGYCLTSMQSALAFVESLHTGRARLPEDKLMWGRKRTATNSRWREVVASEGAF